MTKAKMFREKENQATLLEILEILNQRFNTDFTDADQYFFQQIEEELFQNQSLSQKAKNNSLQNFKSSFDEIFLSKLIERMEDNQELFTKIIDNPELGEVVKNWMLKKIYERFKQACSK
jgi:type I restriction enzyme R subunit